MRTIRQMLPFFAVAGTIALSSTIYSAHRLNSALPDGSPWKLGVWLLFTMIWGFPISRLILMVMGRPSERFQNLGFYMLGLGALTLVSFWAMDLSGLLFAWPHHAPVAVLGASLGLSLVGLTVALRGPAVKRVSIPKAGLHPGLDGLKIVQISDLHIGSMVDKAYVERLVAQVNALEPDLIALTGDMIDGPLSQHRDTAFLLGGLRAPHGVHVVTGNHEYIWGAAAWMDFFRGLGFEVLDNAHRHLEHQGASLTVIGVNDISAGRMGSTDKADARKAAHGAPPSDYTLFLAHQPQAYLEAEKIGVDLMLAGHTHGGQFFPFQALVSLFHKYFQGLYRHQDLFWIYVSPGAGFWGPPNRLGVPSEVTLLELTGA